MRLIAVLLIFVCAAAGASEPPSLAPAARLACPQCGEWDLVNAGFGLAGEKIVITADRVEIPVIGSFCASVLRDTVEDENAKVRAHHMTLNLAAGDTCAVPDADSLRMDVLLPGAWQTEASVIEIAVYRTSGRDAIFTATGWNGMRKDPCSVGGGGPGTDCATIAHAQYFKRLAYLLYALQEGRPPVEVAQLAQRFNVNRFASAVAAFCTRREANSTAGDSRFWSMECQNERVETKLHEWQTWSACRAMPNRTCTMPTERFDKSKRSQ